MGFFSRLMGGSEEQKTASSEFEILAPVSGELVHLEKTNDPAFSSRAVGDGVAVVPQEGTVCAPVSGTVAALFPTEHALGIMPDDSSAQVMLHIGIDTVALNGQGFEVFVENGQKVKKGEPLMKIDISYLKEHAPSLCSPVLCTELGDNQKVRLLKEGEIKAGEPLFAVDVYEA